MTKKNKAELLELTVKLILLSMIFLFVYLWWINEISPLISIIAIATIVVVILWKPWVSSSHKNADKLMSMLLKEDIRLPEFIVISHNHSSESESFMGRGVDSWTDTFIIKSCKKNGFKNISKSFSTSRGQTYITAEPSSVTVSIKDNNTAEVHIHYDILQ